VNGAAATGTLLLEGALVVALDDAGTTGPLSVAVRAGRIAAVEAEEDLRRRFRRARRVDCSGRILLPGLVNAHLHPELHVLKGVLEELDLHDWTEASRFQSGLELLSAPAGHSMQRAAVRAALAEALLGGATYVGTYGVTEGSEAACAAGLRGLGLRGHITIRDARFRAVSLPAVPYTYRLHAEEALTEQELQHAAAAHARGERLVMHAAETRFRRELAQRQFGTTTVRLLHRRGLLSPRTLLSHAVHVDDEEIRLIADAGAAVIASPAAELKLADGLAPFADYLDLGVPLGMGTDAAVCNNATDMFLEMRLLGLSQKLRYGAGAFPAEQILRTATRGGALAVGRPELGVIRAGHPADLVLVDTQNPRMQPLVRRTGFDNVAANLVYAATAQDVTDVMIGGRWRVRERRLLGADPDRIWHELDRAARALYDRIL
jgi:5-methylthioadenosine/S-adenosylhomocysteine deaminase